MITKEAKKIIIDNYCKKPGDTGSIQIQVAVISARIKEIASHLQKFPKDEHSRHGLLKMLGRRKRFASYLKNHDREAYDKIKSVLKG